MSIVLTKTVQKVQSARRQWHPYLRNLALDLGLTASSATYAKFIVLGRSRVGSNFLLSLLNSHSQIKAFGELLSDPANTTLEIPTYLQAMHQLVSLPNDPVQFVQRDLFRKYQKPIAAVGFKLFYYHAQGEQWKPLWSYLKDQKELKIIHLKRRNILKTHLSRKRAEQSQHWVNTNGVNGANASLSLSYEECLSAFTTTRQWEEQYDCFFADHPKLALFYEQVAHDPAGEGRRIQEFLGVGYETLTSSTYKQSNQPLSQAISNYAELKAQFQGTPWVEFFDE